MNIEELISKAEKFNIEEIRKYNPDMEFLHMLAYNASLKLASHYGANENIVKIAVAMMDSKLPEASSLGVAKNHVSMSVEATKELLKDVGCLSESEKENIIKCVEQHHGVDEFYSIEAEVVANADCYKFAHPKGALYYLSMLGRRFHDFEKELAQLEFKLNEKHNALSLPLAKEELEGFYKFFQDSIDQAKR